jgi:hypothetical protein
MARQIRSNVSRSPFLNPLCATAIEPSLRGLMVLEANRGGPLSGISAGLHAKFDAAMRVFGTAFVVRPDGGVSTTLSTSRQIAAERMERAGVAVTGEVFGQPNNTLNSN